MKGGPAQLDWDEIAKRIEEGDLVVVRKTAEACKGDIVVALLNGESTLKRLMIRQGKQFLHSLIPPVIYSDTPFSITAYDTISCCHCQRFLQFFPFSVGGDVS